MNEVTSPVAEQLQRVEVFRGLSREEIGTLFRGVLKKEYSAGSLLFSPDEGSERLFALKIGRVDVYRLTPEGKRLVVRRLAPGAIFGEMGLLGQSFQGCFAEVMEQSLVCVMTREHLLDVLRQRPDVAIRLLEVVGNRVKILEDRLEQALFSPVKARLANFLLKNLDKASGAVLGYTHEDIGDTIGALRQTVTETLQVMRDQQLVEVGRKRIRVIDLEGLAAIAQGENYSPERGSAVAAHAR